MNTQVIISGGGVPGLTLAITLGQAGIRTAVIDPYESDPLETLKKSDTISGHTTALMQDSLNILEPTGVLEDINPYAGQLFTMKIVDMTKGTGEQARITKSFDALEIGRERFGLNIPTNILRAALVEKAREIDEVELYFGRFVHDFTSDPHFITVRLDDGTSLQAKTLVGADGRSSPTREIARIESYEQDYGQDALTFRISHSHDHHNVSTELHRPGGPLTFVPLAGRGESSVVWVEKRDRAQDFLKLKKQEFRQALQDASGGIMGDIAIESAPSSKSLKLVVAKNMSGWRQNHRVFLTGEAAHALHPMGAQGLNLSLRDVKVLADLMIKQITLGLDIGAQSVMKDYERTRKLDVAARAAGTHGLVASLSHDIGAGHNLRRAGLKVLTALSPLKHVLMRGGMTGSFGK